LSIVSDFDIRVYLQAINRISGAVIFAFAALFALHPVFPIADTGLTSGVYLAPACNWRFPRRLSSAIYRYMVAVLLFATNPSASVLRFLFGHDD
jgi:hypothetical protein